MSIPLVHQQAWEADVKRWRRQRYPRGDIVADVEKTADHFWHEVGDQLDAMGKSLAAAVDETTGDKQRKARGRRPSLIYLVASSPHEPVSTKSSMA